MNYEAIAPGSRIKNGDEVMMSNGTWMPVELPDGIEVLAGTIGQWRRARAHYRALAEGEPIISTDEYFATFEQDWVRTQNQPGWKVNSKAPYRRRQVWVDLQEGEILREGDRLKATGMSTNCVGEVLRGSGGYVRLVDAGVDRKVELWKLFRNPAGPIPSYAVKGKDGWRAPARLVDGVLVDVLELAKKALDVANYKTVLKVLEVLES